MNLPSQQASQFDNPTASKTVFANSDMPQNNYESGTQDNTALAFGQVQYSPEERTFLQRCLNDKLGDQFITSRPGPGGKPVHYIATATAITLANQTFGFNGWSSNIVEITQDYQEQVQTGRFSVGFSAIVRVTLKDGTYHEDVGYGTADNLKDRGQAIENAKKKAVSDALKRALRNFGNALGLSVYDKDHLTALSKNKARSKISNGPVKEVGHNTRPENPHFASTPIQSNNVSTSQQPQTQSNGGSSFSTPAPQQNPGQQNNTRGPPPAYNNNVAPPAQQQQPSNVRPPFQRSPTPQQSHLPPQRSPPNSGQQHLGGANRSTPLQSTPPSHIPPQQASVNRTSPPNAQQRFTPNANAHLPQQQLPPQRQSLPPQQAVKRPNEFSNQGFQQNKKARR